MLSILVKLMSFQQQIQPMNSEGGMVILCDLYAVCDKLCVVYTSPKCSMEQNVGEVRHTSIYGEPMPFWVSPQRSKQNEDACVTIPGRKHRNKAEHGKEVRLSTYIC